MTQQPNPWGQPPQQYPQYPPAPAGYPPAGHVPQGWGQPPQYPPAQQPNPWGGPPQQPVAPRAVVGEEFDDFFSGGGTGAPGFSWGRQSSNDKVVLGTSVHGTIVEMAQMQQTDFATKRPLFYDSGEPRMQVAITLQTDLRNWQGITVDSIPTDEHDQKLGPEHDTGLRRIFVKNDMRRAVAVASQKAGQKPRKGGKLGVKVTGFKPTGKGNDMPLYEAVYVAAPEPELSDSFFDQSQQQAPQAPAPQQAPVQPAPMPGYGQVPPGQQQYGQPAPQAPGYPAPGYGNIPVQPPTQQGPPPDFAQPGYQGPPQPVAPPRDPQYDHPPF